MVEIPAETTAGQFGLAVKDYTHSTVPNRRVPDLTTQRILKAPLEGKPIPYGQEELVELARHCTKKEDDAHKAERLAAKSAAAILLASRMGGHSDMIRTGSADNGTWVRISHPPIEG